MKLKRVLIVAFAVCGVVAAAAVATPGLLVTATTPVRGTIAKPFKANVKGVVKLKTKGPIEVADQVLTIQPGGHTGWHSHPGPVLVVIKSGTFTLYNGYDKDCRGQVFETGSAAVVVVMVGAPRWFVRSLIGRSSRGWRRRTTRSPGARPAAA